MAADLNQVALVGRLTREAEVRRTAAGDAIISLRLAFSTRTRDSDGEWGDRSNYIDVTIFGREGLADYLGKGVRVGVSGRLNWHEWKNAEGEPRQNVEIVASDVQLLSSAGEAGARTVAAAAEPDDDDEPF